MKANPIASLAVGLLLLSFAPASHASKANVCGPKRTRANAEALRALQMRKAAAKPVRVKGMRTEASPTNQSPPTTGAAGVSASSNRSQSALATPAR